MTLTTTIPFMLRNKPQPTINLNTSQPRFLEAKEYAGTTSLVNA
jgi:hypothetical protein